MICFWVFNYFFTFGLPGAQYFCSPGWPVDPLARRQMLLLDADFALQVLRVGQGRFWPCFITFAAPAPATPLRSFYVAS